MPNSSVATFLAAFLAGAIVAQELPTISIPDPSGTPQAQFVEVDGALGFSLRPKDGSWA